MQRRGGIEPYRCTISTLQLQPVAVVKREAALTAAAALYLGCCFNHWQHIGDRCPENLRRHGLEHRPGEHQRAHAVPRKRADD